MKPKYCPYLGLKEDPTTALDFPSQGNFCYHARPVSPVSAEHQTAYCLSGNHTACPIYRAAQPVPLPPKVMAPVARRSRVMKGLALAMVPLLVVLTAMLYSWINASGVLSNFAFNRSQGGGGAPRFEIPASGLFGGKLGPTATAIPIQPRNGDSQVMPAPLVSNCEIPSGWLPYTIQPTDSLFRLSVLYGISLQELQEANCLEETTVVEPGDILYVPEPAIVILTGTPRPNETRVYQTPNSGNPNPTEQDGSNPEEPTATSRVAVIPPRINTPVPTNTFLPTSTRLFGVPTRAPSATVGAPTVAPTATRPAVGPTVQPTATRRPPRPTVTQDIPTLVPTATARPTQVPTEEPRPTRTRRPTRTPRPTDPPPVPTNTVAPTNTNPPPPPTDTPPPPPPTATTAPTDTPPPPPPTEVPPTEAPAPTEAVPTTAPPDGTADIPGLLDQLIDLLTP